MTDILDKQRHNRGALCAMRAIVVSTGCQKILVLTMICTTLMSASGMASDMTPEEFVSLVQAAQARIVSLDMKVHEKTVYEDSGELKSETRIVSRWVPDHSFISVSRPQRVQSWERTKRWAKKLLEGEEGTGDADVPSRGRVYQDRMDGPGPGWPLFQAGLDPFGMPWDYLLERASNLSVRHDPAAGTYELTGELSVTRMAYRIDAAKGFVPVLKTIWRLDGRLRSQHESRDLTEVAPGIWIPKEIVFRSMEGESSLLTTYTFDEVRVNVDLEEASFQLTFPPGTFVDDEIAGKKYWMGPRDAPVSGIAGGRLSVNPATTLGAPATDAELEAAAERIPTVLTAPDPDKSLRQRLLRRILYGAAAMGVILGIVHLRSRRRRKADASGVD